MMSPRVTATSPAVRSPKCSRLRSICRSCGDRSPLIGRSPSASSIASSIWSRSVGLAIVAEDQRAHAAPQPRRPFVGVRSPSAVRLHRDRDRRSRSAPAPALRAPPCRRPAHRPHDRSRAGAACRGPSDAPRGARCGIALSAASATQTPCARMMSPSISSGPRMAARQVRPPSAIGKDRTLVGLSLPRHWALSSAHLFVAGQPQRQSRRCARPSPAAGKALSAIAAVAAERASSSHPVLLSHSGSASSDDVEGHQSPGPS